MLCVIRNTFLHAVDFGDHEGDQWETQSCDGRLESSLVELSDSLLEDDQQERLAESERVVLKPAPKHDRCDQRVYWVRKDQAYGQKGRGVGKSDYLGHLGFLGAFQRH